MHTEGFVVWFTGLPSSGKSTLARALQAELRRRGWRVELLDGDEVRQNLTRELGFSRADRDENIRRITYVAHLLARHGVVAITAAISPYRALRDAARQTIGRFVEVYTKCPLEVCIEREVKGLYRRALAGELENFTGVSDPYEEPLAPEVVVETHGESPATCLRQILTRLEGLSYLGVSAGVVYVPIPRYLAQRVEGHWRCHGNKELSRYLAELIARDLRNAAAEELPEGERRHIETCLHALG